MGTKLKSQCAADEWAAYLQKQRDVNAAISADPVRREAARARARVRYAKRRDKTPDKHASAMAKLRDYRSRPDRQEAEVQRRRSPERKAQVKARRLARVYGLTVAEHDALMARQGGACAVCARPFGERRPPHIDHCHATGKVRGLLCARCNSTEGFLRIVGLAPSDFAERLQRYLDAPPAQAKP